MNTFEVVATVALVPGIAAGVVAVWMLGKVQQQVQSHLPDRIRYGGFQSFVDTFTILETHRKEYPTSKLPFWTLAIFCTAFFLVMAGFSLFAIGNHVR